MATEQGAAGVNIELIDGSDYEVVTDAVMTAGIVGFSAKGPLNKIIRLSSTEKMDTVLGGGYNDPKLNQGLYAARGVLGARGNVEFVRPYGETIITDPEDPDYETNQSLKSDAFVVDYNFSASATDSIEINHYSATRYITDGMSADYPGASREIYTIAETITENTNINFVLDTVATGDTVPLFAIINEDPTAANRALSTDIAYPISYSGKDYLTVRTASSNTASKCIEYLAFTKRPSVHDVITAVKIDGTKVNFELINAETTISSVGNIAVAISEAIVQSATVGTSTKIIVSSASGYKVGDIVYFDDVLITGKIIADTKYMVSAINGSELTIVTTGNVAIESTGLSIESDVNIVNTRLSLVELVNVFKTNGFGIGYLVKMGTNDFNAKITAVRGVYVPSTITSLFEISSGASIAATAFSVAENTISVLIDSAIGRKFSQLGVANELYVDIDFDGILNKVYSLTDEGKALAALYLDVDYFFSGTLYNFYGTIVPRVVNDENLYIVPVANSVANGFRFVINENSALFDAAQDSEFDFTLTKKNGLIASTFSQLSYSSTDPGVNYIWAYDPKKNRASSTLSSAWNLFLKKDLTHADVLVSAGTAIKNLFVRGSEELDYTVMVTMLTICELRKDMFAIFDGVDEKRIDKALIKMQSVGAFGNDIGRWGAIYDGRSFVQDTVYTKMLVEVVRSVELIQIIAFNRSSGIYWISPAGFASGRIPTSLSAVPKYIRDYGYGASDKNSEIAKLYDANINPIRVTQSGAFVYGDKTMLRKDTALNRINVIMLVAGLHRRFNNYLDEKTFQINTTQFRNNIQTELQYQLNLIKTSNPSGLYDGVAICNDTNNTAAVIGRNEVIVDIKIKPSKTANFITLRTTVMKTGSDITTDLTIIGG